MCLLPLVLVEDGETLGGGRRETLGGGGRRGGETPGGIGEESKGVSIVLVIEPMRDDAFLRNQAGPIGTSDSVWITFGTLVSV